MLFSRWLRRLAIGLSPLAIGGLGYWAITCPDYYQHIRLELTVKGQPVVIDRTVACRFTPTSGGAAGGGHNSGFSMPVIEQRTMSQRTPDGGAVIIPSACLYNDQPNYHTLVIYLDQDYNAEVYTQSIGYTAPGASVHWNNYKTERLTHARTTPRDEFWWYRTGSNPIDNPKETMDKGAGVVMGMAVADMTDDVLACPTDSPIWVPTAPPDLTADEEKRPGPGLLMFGAMTDKPGLRVTTPYRCTHDDKAPVQTCVLAEDMRGIDLGKFQMMPHEKFATSYQMDDGSIVHWGFYKFKKVGSRCLSLDSTLLHGTWFGDNK